MKTFQRKRVSWEANNRENRKAFHEKSALLAKGNDSAMSGQQH